MPLYFILSGLFFKSYGSCTNFITKKVNKILIPFVFFYLVSYAIFYILRAVVPSLPLAEFHGIQDVFIQRTIFNSPIWFLLCLFWTSLLFDIIYSISQKEIVRFFGVIACAVIGYVLSKLRLYIPLCIDSAFTALPFYYIGYQLKRSNILFPNKYDRYNLVISILLFALIIVVTKFFNVKVDIHFNSLSPLSYIFSTIGVFSVLLFCKKLGRVPIISYIGRYSIIVLCVHHLVQRVAKYIVLMYLESNTLSNIIVFILTITISTLMIPLFIRYFPHVTAQKDVIKINDYK